MKTRAELTQEIQQLRQRVAQLQEPDASCRVIFADVQEGYYEMTLTGEIRHFNESLCEILGYPADELAGMHYRRLMDDAHARQASAIFEHVRQTGEAIKTSRWEITTKTGERRTLSASISLIGGEAGEPFGFQGIVRDVTEQQQAEARYEKLLDTLEHRNILLRTAAEVSQVTSGILKPEALLPQVVDLVRERFDLYYVGLFLIDHTGQWTGETNRWAVLRASAGETAQERLKQDDKVDLWEDSTIGWAITHKKARKCAAPSADERASFDDHLLPMTQTELVLPLIDRGQAIGALTIQSTQASAFDDEDVAALQMMAKQLANAIANAHLYDAIERELTERKRTEKALRLSEERHRTLIENANEAIFVAQDGEIKFFNSKLVQMTGYSTEEFESTPFIRFVHPDDREMVQRYHIQRLRGKDAPANYTFRAVDSEGRTKWARLNVVNITWEDRPAVLSFMADITEQKLAEQALRESEERYRNIFETAAFSIWEEDFSAVKTALDELQAQGVTDIRRYLEEHPEFVQRAAQMIRIVDVNATTLEMFGAESKEEMLGALDQIVFPETAGILREEFIAIAEGRTHFAGETINRTLDGERLNVLVTMTIPSGLDRLDHVLVSLIDITDRVRSEEERARAEEALRKAHQELAQYTDNLERRTAQLQVGAEVAREAAAILDVHQLLDTVVRLISDRFGFYHAGVFLIDDPGEYAVLRAASSEGGQRMLARSHKLRVGKVGIVGHVAKTGEPRIALDVGEDAVFFDNPDLPETRSEMGLPLKIRGQIIGVLDVQDTREAAFTEDDVAVLQTLADQLAVALDNARLIERAEAQLRELSILYGEYSAATWADLVSQKRSLDYVYDRVDVREAEQLPVPALDQALSSGEVISYSEPQASGKTLAAPLKLHDQIIGSIGIQESNGGQAWSADEVALIEAVSEQVALALENARHFAETQKSAQQMRILNEMSQALTTQLDVDGVIAETYWGASRLLDTTNFYIALYDEGTDMISFPLAVEDGMQVEWAARKAGNGLTEYIIHHQTHLLIPENLSGWMTELGIEVIGQQSESWLGVPLSLGDRVMGVMAVQSRSSNAYTEREKNLMTAIASQTAIALQNASLFEQTSVRAEELSILNELSRALASRLDVDEVLKQAYRGVSRLVRAHNFAIGLYDADEDTITFDFHITQSKVDKEVQTIPADQGLSGYIIRHRQGLLIPDNVDGRMAELGIGRVGEPAKSWLGVPLLVGDQVLGVMMVQSFSTPRVYDEDDWRLMQSIASQTAIALQNAYLFQETESALTETETLYLVGETISRLGPLDETFRMLANVLVRQLGYTHAWLGMVERQTGTLTEIASAGVHSGASRSQLLLDAQTDSPALQAISQRQSVVVDAASEREEHVADIPILVGGEAAGLIAVHRPGDRPAIGRRDLGVLSAVADQAAVALQNADLLEEIQRRANQLSAAAEVARDATAILDVDELLDQTVRLISEQFGYYHAGVFLLDDIEEYAVLHAASSEGGQRMLDREHKLPVGKVGIVGNVASTGEPHIALDVGEDAVHFANPDLPNTHSEMGLPLKVRNQIIGVLDVQSTQEAAFSEEDVAVLQTLADQLASAIANARLFQNVRTDALRRALVNEVQEASAASLNPEELLHRAGEVISRRLERPSAVFLWEEEGQHLRPVAIHNGRGEDVYLQADARVTRKMAPFLLSEVVDKRHICLLDPVAHHLGQSAADLVTQVGIEDAVYIPLTARDQVLGVLAIAQTDGHFSEDMEFAETVGRNLSVALENARLYQDALETTEKLQEMDRLKSQFLANMSHELRTPLNSIIGFSRVILKGIDGPLTDMQRTDLEAVYNSGQHLLELINSILDISKIQAGKMELSFEETDLTEIIRVVMSTAKALVKDKPIDLQQSIPQELPIIRADGRRVRQILTNLVGNAAKFTEEGYIKVVAELAGPEVVMRVIDTGVGIPENKLESIFDEFTQVDGSSTRAVGGTGLGLSITRHFVEMHGGRIWVESVLDEGSTFCVALPIAGPPDYIEEAAEAEMEAASLVEEKRRAEGPEPGQKVVLCVDDDEGVIMLFRRYLSKQGYYVIGLTDGRATLDTARTHRPFAITLDVMMPGKDGWEIIQELKSHPDTHDIPVIICSIISDHERGISLGASSYLVKPILESDLLSALERLGQEDGRKDQQRKVLVVDDHPEDRDLIRRMLESQTKYSVIEASSGQEAIAMVQVARPDAIVLDLMMPEVDGFAVLESVKANKDTRSIPIIVVTAKELTEEERRILNKGVETLLQKGLFEQQELLADVASALERLSMNSQREGAPGHTPEGEKTDQNIENTSE